MDTSQISAFLTSTPMPRDRAAKKNYTEQVSQLVTDSVSRQLQILGLRSVVVPGRGRDKQFMGGYASKGVDTYLSDEKHGLLISSGSKGILYNVGKNVKNRYRDMVMEALELHKRFPYAVCGHFIFLSASEVAKPNKRFGTVMGEMATLMSNVSGRARPEDPPELYEVIGIMTLEPGDPSSLNLAPAGLPAELRADTYCDRIVHAFNQRNPFYA